MFTISLFVPERELHVGSDFINFVYLDIIFLNSAWYIVGSQ